MNVSRSDFHRFLQFVTKIENVINAPPCVSVLLLMHRVIVWKTKASLWITKFDHRFKFFSKRSVPEAWSAVATSRQAESDTPGWNQMWNGRIKLEINTRILNFSPFCNLSRFCRREVVAASPLISKISQVHLWRCPVHVRLLKRWLLSIP